MQLSDVLAEIIEPTMALLRLDSPEARVMLLAIGLQESRFEHRVQIGGPARGFWQFEHFGGVVGVLSHPASKKRARDVCAARCVEPVSHKVYRLLAEDDILACAFARLLLWTDPHPLPKKGDVRGAWDYYLRNWRPGRPHRKTWDALYARALEEL